MNVLHRLFLVFILAYCAGAKGETSPELKSISVNGNHFIYREEYVMHTITSSDWEKRAEFGVPSDARPCGGSFYISFQVIDGERTGKIGLLVEEKWSIRAKEPTILYEDERFSAPLFFYGIFLRRGQFQSSGDYLLLSPLRFQQLDECASRKELSI